MDKELLLHRNHPYDRKGYPKDVWIDTFREVFCRSDAGVRALSYLASQWHFLARDLLTEEQRVQRQCFVDLLRYCGIVDADTGSQVMQLFLGQDTSLSRAQRFVNWFHGLTRIRTKRTSEGVQHA